MLIVGPNAPSNSHEALASLEPIPVLDLQARLAELVKIMPLAAWCVNPDGHRENSAYGRLRFGGEHPLAMNPDAEEHTPKMATLAGIWRVIEGNVFELEKPIEAWCGRDTILWSRGQSLQLLPLDRSFAVDCQAADLVLEDLTETEAEEIVSQHLQVDSLEVLREELGRQGDVLNQLERFHIVCWDAVTGVGADRSWSFDNVLTALRYLVVYERDHDRQFRSDGAVSCMHIGFAGSGDSQFEDIQSARFQLGLRRLGLRLLRRGYRPQDANDLVRLCNGTLQTLHVDFAGYAKDLLWASTTRDQQDTLLAQLEIHEDTWHAWYKSAHMDVDPVGTRLAIARIGESVWNRLLPKSQHFLATALLHLQEQGHAPQLDYAPISIEVVKVLEVELGHVFEAFRDSLNGKRPVHDPEKRGERSLVAFLEGGKPPELGVISHLLRQPEGNPSELMSSLHGYLSSLSNGNFLTSRKFARSGLERVLNKYRNSGAHDCAIREDVCRECVEEIVGEPGKPGYIVDVSAWKRK